MKNCEELIQPNQLGKYIGANTRQCKNKATKQIKDKNYCTRHAKYYEKLFSKNQ